MSAMMPPVSQANRDAPIDPAYISTPPGEAKIPEPIIAPTMNAMPLGREIVRCSSSSFVIVVKRHEIEMNKMLGECDMNREEVKV